MKILDIKVMRGPNYWSNYRQKLVVMKLDLEGTEGFPTNKIDGFAERLEALMPSLYSHRCSKKEAGGFFQRVREGTWMGHVVEHVALELQSLAGMECGFGRTRSTGEHGVYHVVFSYQVENAGIYAAHAAVNVALALENDMPYNISKDIKELSRINRMEGLGPSTISIINEARKRNIPYKRLNTESLIMLGYGVHQKTIQATMACTTSSIGVEIASNKEATKQLLANSFVPVPKGKQIKTMPELEQAIEEFDFPLVVKPLNGNQGKGVTTNIISKEQAHRAFELAKTISPDLIVEKYINGQDYRFLVIDYKLAAIAKRTPAMVMGDDKSTIQELIDKTNSDPRRGEGHEKILTTIKVDGATNSILVEKNLTLNSVLPFGEILYLKDTANLSTGGTSRDVTDVVHPYNVFLAERVARLMNLDVCGIDIVAKDIQRPITEKTGAVVEVNSGPGFRMHLSPTKGLARNVAEPLIKMLFPPGTPSRIPIVAVTGTNGKTTTVRLIAHIAKLAGHNVGFTNTDGVYIQDQEVFHGDCSGPASAEVVLRDPIVDFAVLECARGGILRAGLGFDKCDVSIVTNISEDHLGLDDINTIEQLVRVKSVVPRSTFDDGYAILNADDELVYNIKNDLSCNIALFSLKDNNERIKQHCENKGIAAFIEKGYFTVCKGQWRTRIIKVKDVPLTFEGRAENMIQNILTAILTATVRDFPVEVIRTALTTFIPSPAQTPGRFNIFKLRNFELMVDYAHNMGALIELKKFLNTAQASLRVGIIAGVGDRRDEDIRNIGFCAGEMFDEIIIRHDKDSRGRANEVLTNLLMEGIIKANANALVSVISDECEAIQYAIDNAREGTFIVVCSEHVKETLEFVQQIKEAKKCENGIDERDLNIQLQQE
jgi:cyanophycin synthetase